MNNVSQFNNDPASGGVDGSYQMPGSGWFWDNPYDYLPGGYVVFGQGGMSGGVNVGGSGGSGGGPIFGGSGSFTTGGGISMGTILLIGALVYVLRR